MYIEIFFKYNLFIFFFFFLWIVMLSQCCESSTKGLICDQEGGRGMSIQITRKNIAFIQYIVEFFFLIRNSKIYTLK